MGTGFQLGGEQSFLARYEALFRVSRVLGAYRDPKELFRILADELKRTVDFNFVGLFLYDESSNTVHNPLLETMGGRGFAIPANFPAEDTITWWVYRHQKPVVISSRDEEKRFPRMMELYRHYAVESACVLPLTTAHRRLGSLGFAAEHRNGYSREEVRYLCLVADQVALAVDNALRDQEQRRGETLQAEGQKLSHTGTWVWNVLRGEVTWSPEHYRIFGLAPGEKKPSWELFWEGVHPDDRSHLREIVDRAVRDCGDFQQEFRIVPPNGTVRCVQGTGHAMVDEAGELVEFVGTSMDITERKRAEEVMRKQRAQFERLFELAPEAVVLRDGDNRVLRANREFTALFGYTLEESVGRDLTDLIVPDELRGESLQLRAPVDRGERVRAEVVRRRKDGTLLNVELLSAPVSVDGGDPEIYTIYRDISQRKQAEDALRRSEAYLAEGQRLSHTGSWARDVSTGDLFFSAESYRIFGLDPHTKVALDLLLNRVHPEDRASVEETIRRAIRERSHFERDYRILLDDATIRHIHVVGHPVMDAAGKSVEFVGTHMDVTEQHRSRMALENAFEEIKTLKDQLYQENVALRQEIDETSMFEEIVGKSGVLRELLKQVETVAPTESTVLICGETGTGKELIARAIHNLSARRSNAIVKLNCAAIPSGLLESELFGHERGAFTGALAQRIGRFELANRGTVFLDEIGEIPLELQPKLLRVLQEREYERLGSSDTRRTDARLIAATNRDLAQMVDEQKFRLDLFYRLNVFPIRVPALRERPEDVPLLARHFAELFSRRMRKSIRTIPPETMNAMMRYHWPGNVRELQNVIERAVILSTGGVLQVAAADLTTARGAPAAADRAEAAAGRRARNAPAPAPEQILQVLKETGGRVGGAGGAAARLGLKRTTFIAYMKRFGINPRTVISHF